MMPNSNEITNSNIYRQKNNYIVAYTAVASRCYGLYLLTMSYIYRMKKILFFLIFCTSLAKAQQTGIQPGTTAGSGQLIAKIAGSGVSATLSFGFGNSSFFNVPTTKAFMDSINNVKTFIGSGYLPLHATADNAARLGGALPSAYYLSTNPNNYISSYTELDPTVPAYAKLLTAFSVIKTSTDALYPTQTGTNASGTWGIDISGNSATTTILQTPRTINGVSFNGGSNISFNSDAVSQGSTNLYFSNALARGSVSATGSLNYNSSTGVFNYVQPTNVSTFTNDANYATLNSPLFTGNFRIQPANGAGVSYSNSGSAMLFITRNTSNINDELSFISATGTGATGGTGGFSFYGNNSNGGTSGGFVYLGGVQGTTTDWTFPHYIVVGSVAASSVPSGLTWWNPSTKQFETVTWAQAASGIGTTVVGGVQRLVTFTTPEQSATSPNPTYVYNYTLPANTFSSDGQFIDGIINGSAAIEAGANQKIQFVIGGNVVWDSGTFNSPSNVTPFIISYVITRISGSSLSVSVTFNRQTSTIVIQPETVTGGFTFTSGISTAWALIAPTAASDLTLNRGFYRLNP